MPARHPLRPLAFALLLLATVSAHGQTAATPAAPVAASVAASPAAPAPASPNPLTAFVTQFAAATGIHLVAIPAGSFVMGSAANEALRDDNEGPVTKVTLTKDFFLAATTVTQAQWTAVMSTSPSQVAGATLPVDSVSWNEALAFCQKLTVQEQAAGRLPAGYVFTLPTEAQWEYACRAGTTGAYAGDLDTMAWYLKNSGNTSHPVATKMPNAWGLYDMHGNVWEWCLDWFGTYPGGSVNDLTGPLFGTVRIYRGGSWFSDAAFCRSASRGRLAPAGRSNNLGFRPALVPP